MIKEKDLPKLQGKMKQFEKLELTLKGSINTLLKNLKRTLGQTGLDNDSVAAAVKSKISDLKKKKKKAKMLLTEKLEQIDEMSDLLED